MAIVANKFKGIRCAKCNDEEEAKYSRMHNDANVLALGADYIDTSKAIPVALRSEIKQRRCQNFM